MREYGRARYPSFVIACFWLFLCPSSNVAAARYPPPVPKYEVRLQKSLWVAMRDGTRLSTDLYIPKGLDRDLPTVLIRTPYNKKSFRRDASEARFFAGQGYTVAVQDVRGRFESEGIFTLMKHEARDGFDMVNWLAAQPWSNGKVGTYGCSYLSEVQMQLAKLRNPHHAAMIPQAGGGVNRYDALIWGGAIELALGFGWMYGNGSKVFLKPPPGAPEDFYSRLGDYFNPAPVVPDIRFPELWRSLPLVDMMQKAGGPPTDWEDFVSHEPADPWWDQLGYLKETDRFDVPALLVNSWYDFGVGESLTLFQRFQTNAESARARDNQYIIVSPSTHCASEEVSETTVIGKRPVGDPRLDYWNLYLDWFDHWLRGIDNAVTGMPKLQIYVMGKNKWRAENEWPLTRMQTTPYYFHSDGHANSRFGTGLLNVNEPSNEPPDRYIYDPDGPVPSVGGPLCCTGTPDAPPGSYDQSEVETRNDVLVYSTSALEDGIEVTGPVEVVLHVSSSARDTDFTAKLVDVYPDGTAFMVLEGILRARYRNGYAEKAWMKPEGVYEAKIKLGATSNYFPPGHRIRLEISSSSFPRFDRNLNTGGNNYDETDWVVAKNTVHHSSRYPSHILLPVIP